MTSSDDERPRGETYRIDCPECDWQSDVFEEITDEIAAKVDAEIHYVENHDSRIPEDVPFGNNQCPRCLDTDGFNGTVSCSGCGFVPDKVRA
jgi:hypothetical protein